MDHKLWIDAIQKSPTAGYLNKFLTLAESLHVRGSSDLEGLSAREILPSYFLTAYRIIQQA
ncbi:hypothetical protein E4U15_006412 [Claviceps sp. LM218 group G6]|nr:hypothetical protein E4U15_006412 [Claviceps sp. LM218 group G6]